MITIQKFHLYSLKVSAHVKISVEYFENFGWGKCPPAVARLSELISNAEKWRNATEVSLFPKRTKSFWSRMNYVRLHYFHSSRRRVKRLLWPCGYCVPKT